MAGPTDLNPNAEPSVRPYSMSPSEAAYYRSREFGPVLGRAVSGLGAGALDAASQGLSGLDQFLSGNAPYQQFERQMAENNADYELNRSGVLTGNTGFSRQARIAAASNDVQNAPAMVAQRNAAEARQAAMMDNQAQARQEEQARQVESLANAKAAEVINSQNEVIRARQEQQALLATPLGTDPAYAGKRPMASTPTGQQTAPQAKSLIDTTDFRGSYTQNAPTYTAPKKSGNVGTIDLRADAPPPPQPMTADGLLQMAGAAARNGQLAEGRILGQIAESFVGAEATEAGTEKTQIDTAKSIAETQKIISEISGEGAESISPERLLTSRNQSAQRLHSAAEAIVSSSMETDPSLAILRGDERNAAVQAQYQKAMTILRNLPIYSDDFRLLDMASSLIDEPKQGGTAKPKAKSGPTDMFKTPRAE